MFLTQAIYILLSPSLSVSIPLSALVQVFTVVYFFKLYVHLIENGLMLKQFVCYYSSTNMTAISAQHNHSVLLQVCLQIWSSHLSSLKGRVKHNGLTFFVFILSDNYMLLNVLFDSQGKECLPPSSVSILCSFSLLSGRTQVCRCPS